MEVVESVVIVPDGGGRGCVEDEADWRGGRGDD